MKKNGLIVVVLVSLIISSCSPLYVPSTRNAALFRDAGEFQGSLHFGQGIDAQAAVSVSKHIGLMGGYNYVSRNTADDSDSDYIKHTSWEGAVGYYENSDKIVYEFFGGYGRGEGTAFGDYFGVSNARANGTYAKLFIQPSVGSNHRIFNWIVTARVSHIDFDNIYSFDETTQAALPPKNPDPVLFIEPSFTGRVFFGKSPIYSQFQAGFSYTTQGETVFDYEPFHFSFGFGLRLGGKPRDTSSQE
jgi:hypothetical protein